MKTRFYLKLRGKVKKATHPIYVALYEGEQTEIIYTGQRIATDGWSKKEMQPIDQDSDIFKAIAKVKATISKASLRLEADEQAITPFTLKQAYETLKKKKGQAQLTTDQKAKAGLKTVYSLAKKYKDALPDKYSKSTKKTVKISIDQFLLFLDKCGHRTLEIKDLTDEIISDYGKYLLEKRKLADSTHNKRTKHLRWFLKSIKFAVTIEPRKIKKKAIIALTVPELRALEAVDVTTHKDKLSHEFLQRAKDMFLLGCYTALRISDLKRVNTTNSANGFISLTTQKNNEIFKMPIVKPAQAILDRYNGRPPRISEQEVNRSIKKVCELAKINTLLEIEGTSGGRGFIKNVPKYDLITSHIAAKTFITNAKELWNLDPAEVAGIVRKDLKTMLNHYFKPPVDSATVKMLNADKAQMKIA